MSKTVLVTGGAGFIGSHAVDAFLAAGYHVRVVDAMLPQVHGESTGWPINLAKDVELVRANLCDVDQWKHLLSGIDALVHLAADVGVGQSMYEITRYVRNNVLGTAALLEAVLHHGREIPRMVVASSMSIYGEGAYRCDHCGIQYPLIRSAADLDAGCFDPRCGSCQASLHPIPTNEEKPLKPTSVYAVNKRDHEEMVLAFGRAYHIPSIALRFFNVYGPRQALSNPYTGVVAIFGSRLLNGRAPRIFEDGQQSRDFVHVSDIVQAVILSARTTKVDFDVFNVGTGRSLSVEHVARALASEIGQDFPPEIVHSYRAGDVRHCYGDISRIREMLGYEPRVRFEDGIQELVGWMKEQSAVDRGDEAYRELQALGLTK